LYKRYRTIDKDFKKLIESLKDNPMQGVDLGFNVRKLRMAISAKGTGKSGGARVITYTALVADIEGILRILTIYDKADRESMSGPEIKRLLKDEGWI
jgi:hypothetical protein